MSNSNITNTRVFAKDLSFYKYVWCFTIGSIFGVVYEEIIAFIKLGYYESRRGVVFGPFNPLYGAAFVISILLFHKYKSPIKLFLIGSVFGGVFEYILGLAQEIFIGTRSWSYEGQFLNIHGRTSVVYALIWGFFIVLFVKVIYPFISKYIERLPIRPGNMITKILIVFMALNMFVTFSMLIRFNLRSNGFEPLTPLGELYDNVFNDDVVYKLFPDMIPLEE